MAIAEVVSEAFEASPDCEDVEAVAEVRQGAREHLHKCRAFS